MKEKLSWKEAEAVVRAYRAEHGMSSDVEIDVLAATLGTTPAEVQRLAACRRFVDRSGVLSAALALGVAGMLTLFLGLSSGSNVTYGPTSRLHAIPARPEKFVVIDLSSGKEPSLDPEDQPETANIKTL